MATVKHTFLPEEAQFLAATFPAFSKVNGTNFPVSGLAFDAAADEFAFLEIQSSKLWERQLNFKSHVVRR